MIRLIADATSASEYTRIRAVRFVMAACTSARSVSSHLFQAINVPGLAAIEAGSTELSRFLAIA